MKQYRVSRYTLTLDHENVEADGVEQLEQELIEGNVTGELAGTEHVEVAQDLGRGGICEIAEVREGTPIAIRHYDRKGNRHTELEGIPMSTG